MGIDLNEEIKKYRKNSEEKLEVKDSFSYLEFSNDINKFINNSKKLDLIENYNIDIFQRSKKIENFINGSYEKSLSYKEAENLNLKREIKFLKMKEERFIKSLLKILDSVEWVQRFSKAFANNALERSLFNSNKMIKKELINMNIVSIDNVGEIFNENIHKCIEVIYDENKMNNEVVDILKKGYIYNGDVIRVADVVVSKREKEE